MEPAVPEREEKHGGWESGVYYGWARVEQGPVYKMVMSVGWNPQFQNEKRSMVSGSQGCTTAGLGWSRGQYTRW